MRTLLPSSQLLPQILVDSSEPRLAVVADFVLLHLEVGRKSKENIFKLNRVQKAESRMTLWPPADGTLNNFSL